MASNHSLQDEQPLPSLPEDPEDFPPFLIHCTSVEKWATIFTQGIIPIEGTDTTLWCTYAGLPTTEYLLYLDVDLCFRDFTMLKIRQSMFRCQGSSKAGIIPPMYFLKVINNVTGTVI